MRRLLLILGVLGAALLLGRLAVADEPPFHEVLEHILDDVDVDLDLDEDALLSIGEEVRIGAGERVDGDVVVVNAGVRLGAGSQVEGTVVVLGGSVRVGVGAQVEGDAIAINGDVHLAAGSQVEENAVAVGGQIYTAAGAQVHGRAVELRLDDRVGQVLDDAIKAGAALAPKVERGVAPGTGRVVERSRVQAQDQATFGGVIQIPPDTRQTGDVLVVGGRLDVAGAVDGDVAVMGGHVRIFETGEINGEMATFGAHVERDVPLDQFSGAAPLPGGGVHGRWHHGMWPGREVGRHMAVVNLIVIASFGVVVLLFNLLLEPLLESADVELQQGYVRAMFVGLLLEVSIPPLLVLLAITFVLIPVAVLIILAAALGATVAMGLMSRQLGRRLMGGPGSDGTLLRTLVGYTALVGLAALGQVLMIAGAPGAIAWTLSILGYFLLVGAMTLGLGAVALAQFGRWGRPSGPPPELPVPPAPTTTE